MAKVWLVWCVRGNCDNWYLEAAFATEQAAVAFANKLEEDEAAIDPHSMTHWDVVEQEVAQ